jgi:DNA-binding XRE family transcriptional regulator
MAKYKRSDFVSALDEIRALPRERRERIEAGAAKLLADIHLAELRKAMNVTQVALARKAGVKQAEISRIENNPQKVQLQTMERYVKSLGGSLKLVAEFPDGTVAYVPVAAGKPVKSRIGVEKRARPRSGSADAA